MVSGASSAQRQALHHERRQAIEIAGRNGAIEQPLGRGDLEVVSGIDDVHDERAVNDVVSDPKIEVAERRRVGNRERRRQQQRRDEHNVLNQAA